MTLRSECELRDTAAKALKRLYCEAADQSLPVASWLRHDELIDADNLEARFFHFTGFLLIKNFCSLQECKNMKQEMVRMVEEKWDIQDENKKFDTFGTDKVQNTARGDYFIDSANRVHYFTEPSVVTNDPKTGQITLKDEYNNHNKINALNKVGHGLHLSPGVFHEYATSHKIRQLVQNLGWTDPVIPQSMYIFKQARIGGPVTSHQDSTFLYTTPQQTCLGLWLALDNATLENGCLWVRPQSHREAVRRQYRRNPQLQWNTSNDIGTQPEASQTDSDDNTKTPPPKFIMTELYSHDIVWDGKLPGDGTFSDLLQAGFLPIECQAGDLLVFCGELDHLSLANTSEHSRHTFQLHLIEGPRQNIVWSSENWLQYPEQQPFLSL